MSPVSQDSQKGWVAKALRAWHLTMLRFAITLEDVDRQAAIAIATEIDALGQPRGARSSFGLFRKTSAKLCEAILQPRESTYATLRQHLVRIDDDRLRRTFAAAINFDQLEDASVRPPRGDNRMKFDRLANMLARLSPLRALRSMTDACVDRGWRRRKPIAIGFALIAMAAAGIGNGPAVAEDPDITSRRASERTDFTNAEIKDGFFKIAFHAEWQVGAPAERVRKYDEPVRIFVVSKSEPDRRPEIAAIVDDIRARVNHLDVAITNDRAAANFFVTLVAERDLRRTIRSLYGDDRAKRIQKSLNPQCLSGIGKDSRFRIRRAEVILPVDAGEFQFYDCAYEELLQALGAINDDRSVPWTMFNDDVQMGFFDVYDQYLLNILYDPRVRPGMTKQEVGALLPDVLSTTRRWVTNARLPRRADIEHQQPQHD
jgi:hypothetical protein